MLYPMSRETMEDHGYFVPEGVDVVMVEVGPGMAFQGIETPGVTWRGPGTLTVLHEALAAHARAELAEARA